jgi:hypothetical protein
MYVKVLVVAPKNLQAARQTDLHRLHGAVILAQFRRDDELGHFLKLCSTISAPKPEMTAKSLSLTSKLVIEIFV